MGGSQHAQHVRSARALLSRRAEPERGAAQAPSPAARRCLEPRAPPHAAPGPSLHWRSGRCLSRTQLPGLPGLCSPGPNGVAPSIANCWAASTSRGPSLGGRPGCEVTDLDPGQKGREGASPDGVGPPGRGGGRDQRPAACARWPSTAAGLGLQLSRPDHPPLQPSEAMWQVDRSVTAPHDCGVFVMVDSCLQETKHVWLGW